MMFKNNTNKTIEKPKKSLFEKLCTLTLVFEIISSVLLIALAFAPALSGFAGIGLGMILGIFAVVFTICTIGIIWANEGFRNFFAKGFSIVSNILNGTEKIVPTLKPYILAITLPLIFLSIAGFTCNLIYFLKHNKANKGKFIASIIFLVIALIGFIVSLICYLGK